MTTRLQLYAQSPRRLHDIDGIDLSGYIPRMDISCLLGESMQASKIGNGFSLHIKLASMSTLRNAFRFARHANIPGLPGCIRAGEKTAAAWRAETAHPLRGNGSENEVCNMIFHIARALLSETLLFLVHHKLYRVGGWFLLPDTRPLPHL
jgi:hypothetical protein